MSFKKPHLIARFFDLASKVHKNELEACALSFFTIFLLMSSYYVLRPVRDAMASDWSDAEVSILWTLNFVFSALAVALFGWAASRLRFQLLVPAVYSFFSASFAIFYLITAFTTNAMLFDKIFYVWVSIFSLFNISVFWSFTSDLYSKEQSNRLFSIIATGASVGAIVGPSIPTLFSGKFGIYSLVLLTAACIAATVPLYIKLLVLKQTKFESAKALDHTEHDRIGGNPFKGFLDFIRIPFLRNIGLFIVLYTSISTIMYFQQKNLLAPYTLATRSQILGGIDWVVNILTILIAFFATGRIVKKYGMPLTLSIIPFTLCAGLLVLAFASSLAATLGLQVMRRSGNYAITRPAREMLFTQVTREERFKAKPVIDIVAYRGGDMMTSWGFALLTDGLGLSLGFLAGIGALIAAAWGATGFVLGKTYQTPLKKDSR